MSSPSAIEELLRETFASGRTLQYRKKELIYRLGDVPSGVYLVTSGLVKVYTLDSRAEENIILTFGPGEILLLRWGLTGRVDDVYIAAMTPVEVVRMPRQEFISAIYERPQLAVRLLEILSGHFELLINHITNLDFRNANQRVACRLLMLASRYGQAQPDGGMLLDRLHTSHTYLAGSTGLARETVTRELNRLEDAGHLSRRAKDIVVKDIGKLAELVGMEWPLAA